MKFMSKGVTLVELLVSVGLSLGLALILIQFHVQSRLMSDRQQALSRQLESAAALVHILSHAVRDALHHVVMPDAEIPDSGAASSKFPGDNCTGISLGDECHSPVSVWLAGAPGTPTVTGALAGREVLQLKQTCCGEWLAEQFYLAHRGGDIANPLSLFRRRMRPDGTYTAASELAEDITALSYRFVTEPAVGGGLSLAEGNSVANGWSVKAVRIHARVGTRLFSFTITSRHRRQVFVLI